MQTANNSVKIEGKFACVQLKISVRNLKIPQPRTSSDRVPFMTIMCRQDVFFMFRAHLRTILQCSKQTHCLLTRTGW